MKKWEKLLALIMVAILAMLTACTTDAPASSSSTASPSGETSQAAAGNNDNTSGGNSAEAPAGDGAFKIGLATREITADYNRDIISNVKAVVEAAGGTLTVTDANADFQKHNENIESLINSGIDGLIIVVGDAQQLTPLAAKAKEKGIPVITVGIGSTVPDTITEIGGDNPLMSVLAANAFLSSIDYKGDVYVVWVPGAPLLETRKRIFEAICADFPAVTIHEVPAEHNPGKVQTQIEEILTANPEPGSIAGIFGTYDTLVSGGYEAIRRAGRDEIKMTGIDGDRIAFQMLFQEGSPFVATVVQDVPDIGKQAANILLGVLNGTIDPESVPSQTSANCYVATRHNGVEAAELRWTESFWEEASLDKSEVEAAFPQTEDVVITYPSVP